MANNVRDALRELVSIQRVRPTDRVLITMKEPLSLEVIEMIQRQAQGMVADGVCRTVMFIPCGIDVEIYTEESDLDPMIRKALGIAEPEPSA
jgi:hypothetical protein